jgi:cytochrome c oxidase subunit 2
MLGQLMVMPEDEFDAWVAQSRRGIASAQDAVPDGAALAAGSNLIEQGRNVAAQQGCLKCHTIDGDRHIGPTWLDLYMRREKLQDGSTVIADEAYITKSMMDPGAQIVAGYQNVMPSFQGRMTPPEVAAVVEYIKSLRTPVVRSGPSQPPVYESIPSRTK